MPNQLTRARRRIGRDQLDHENVVNMHDVIDDVFANKLYSAPARGPEPARPPGPRGPYILCRSRRRPRASAQW